MYFFTQNYKNFGPKKQIVFRVLWKNSARCKILFSKNTEKKIFAATLNSNQPLSSVTQLKTKALAAQTVHQIRWQQATNSVMSRPRRQQLKRPIYYAISITYAYEATYLMYCSMNCIKYLCVFVQYTVHSSMFNT